MTHREPVREEDTASRLLAEARSLIGEAAHARGLPPGWRPRSIAWIDEYRTITYDQAPGPDCEPDRQE
jgi:hypothetical protein